jgi:hypothetical protein
MKLVWYLNTWKINLLSFANLNYFQYNLQNPKICLRFKQCYKISVCTVCGRDFMQVSYILKAIKIQGPYSQHLIFFLTYELVQSV